MIYVVTHRTTYDYTAEASAGRCILRLLPTHSPRQRVLAASLRIEPGPAERSEFSDFFGNRSVLVRFATRARRHVFEARARVSVKPLEPPHALLTPSIRDIAQAALASRDLTGTAPSQGLFASRNVPLLDAARDYGRTALEAERPVLDAAIEIMRRIHADFAYDTTATDVSTPLERVFAGRRGVCQDFAHAMIATLRAAGIPAFYVSGYLRTVAAGPGPRLVGADASHAWVSVWCGPGVGLVDLDPTNALIVGEDHVTLATGRDYGDVAPVAGVVLASGDHHLEVAVDMVPDA
ncbi:MAG: transglutaminase N-terminal domain-containing protein [Labrys sp. (in: a-proteobacteria)]